MAQLQQFLRYLERDDVKEVVLQTGAAAAVRIGDQLRPLTRQALGERHIAGLIEGTPVVELIPSGDSPGEARSIDLEGRRYVVSVARSGNKLLLRFGLPRPRADRAAPAEPATSGIELDSDDERRNPPVARPAAPEAARPHTNPPPPITVSADGQLTELLLKARKQRASDLHIVSERPAQLRVLGQMQPVGDALPHDRVEQSLKPLLSERHAAQLEERGYADFACEIEGAGRFRVNVCRQRTGLKGCFRSVASTPPALDQLGLPEELTKVLGYHQGLVVVSGPNGSGKTTTMAALVDLFNSSRPVHIITVEDPVEIVHPPKRAIVTQREVGEHTKSFHTALKAALREDPDVIAIGELRDRETVEMALGAAETGHLVLATMSTPSGARTIDRLVDMFPPDDQSQVRATLAGALKFVISQRLVPTADGQRRVAAVELITGNIPLWRLIREDKLYQLPSLQQRGRGFGMIRIEDSLTDLMSRGLISPDTARAFADDPRSIGAGAQRREPAPAPQQQRPAVQPDEKRGGLRNLFGRKG